jgi:hypothetical protein
VVRDDITADGDPNLITTPLGTAVAGANIATFSTYNPTLSASDFTVSVDWGDGSAADQTALVENGPNGSFVVTGGHSYQEVGAYTVTVKITSAAGNTATAYSVVRIDQPTVTRSS